jgi:hypothetical protein
MDAFVINFKWEDARYPRRKSLQELVEMIHSVRWFNLLSCGVVRTRSSFRTAFFPFLLFSDARLHEFLKFQQVIKLDEELKHKATEYNNVVSAIQQRKKRETFVC